ncbi:protein S100-B-like [Phyllobates terribilis]|uniref:protein S100-B-like n=1 Tax=Phyllobates terribilis TaxID=111132 RepID=UPI003CCA9BB7
MDSLKPESTCSSRFPNLPDGQELTELECSMVNIIRIFHSFSNDHCKLRRKNLKELINKQMSTFVKKVQDTDTLEVIFRDLDANHDREIDFSEFAALIAMVTSACHTSFHEAQ